MCWRATRKLACQSEKNFFPHVELFFFFFHFLWKVGLGYEAQAGSVFSGNVKFPEQHILEREKLNSTAGQQLFRAGSESSTAAQHRTIKIKHCSSTQGNKNAVRIIICKVEHMQHAIKVVFAISNRLQAELSFFLWGQ